MLANDGGRLVMGKIKDDNFKAVRAACNPRGSAMRSQDLGYLPSNLTEGARAG